MTWKNECIRWWGRVLTGLYSHFCFDWDELPVDETTFEFSCCNCMFDIPVPPKPWRLQGPE